MNDSTISHKTEPFTKAAAIFFPVVSSVATIEDSDSIAKVETPDGVFALRRWSEGTTPDRVRIVHSVLTSLAELPLVPSLIQANGESVVQVEQRYFDATSWLDGKPLRRPERRPGLRSPVFLPRTCSIELIEELASAIAHMHVATKAIAGKRKTPSLPLNVLVASIRASWMQQRGRLRPIAHLTPDIQRWLRTGERALPLAERILSNLPEDSKSELVVGHTNLWPEHVLIERQGGAERLTGILDYKQVAATSPVVDLAQLATHFNGWSDESAEIVIGAYGEVNRLMPPERRVLPAIAALDLVAETGRILTATYVELGSPNAPESMRDAAGVMLRSLEAATKTMERLEGINVPGPRKWVHRPPKPGQTVKERKLKPRNRG
jgi:Ser/Thr protein kinase RdoA (MazF antagonist)